MDPKNGLKVFAALKEHPATDKNAAMAVADDVSTDQLKQGEYIVATTEDPAENPAKNLCPQRLLTKRRGQMRR